MKKMMILATLTVMLMPFAARAQEMQFRLPSPEVLEKLDLSQEQKDQLKDIHSKVGDQVKQLQEKCREQANEIKEALGAAEPNKKAISKAAKQLGETRSKMLELQAESLADALVLLTPQQREQVKEWVKSHKGAGLTRGFGAREGIGQGRASEPNRREGLRQRQGFGDDRGRGFRGEQGMRPEIRERIRERLQDMEPEKRAQMLRRFRQNWSPEGEEGRGSGGQRMRDRQRDQDCPPESEPKED
ncbi:MAG TPA: Spy/CpxP family protein refolding chaperone [bacterium]|nr:Spy/CpxP family protein refolding chaperone [bacterium]